MKYELHAQVIIEFESDQELTDEQAQERATNELLVGGGAIDFEFDEIWDSATSRWVRVCRS